MCCLVFVTAGLLHDLQAESSLRLDTPIHPPPAPALRGLWVSALCACSAGGGLTYCFFPL